MEMMSATAAAVCVLGLEGLSIAMCSSNPIVGPSLANLRLKSWADDGQGVLLY